MICGQIGYPSLQRLFAPYGIAIAPVAANDPIPGSFWGEPEAGLIGNALYLRGDTPVHSALHEACHWICMDEQRRSCLHTDAGGEFAEENAVCYLQILLSDFLTGFGRERHFADMDAWGYSFRLGSARAWFEQDAEDARDWLLKMELIDGYQFQLPAILLTRENLNMVIPVRIQVNGNTGLVKVRDPTREGMYLRFYLDEAPVRGNYISLRTNSLSVSFDNGIVKRVDR